MSIAFLGIFFFKSFWLIAIFFILHDIAWTFQSGTTTAWVIDALNYGEHSKKIATLFARFFFFEKTGAILGGLIGLVVVAINFRFIWLVIALANIITFFIVLKYMDETNFKSKKIDSKIFLQTFIQAKDSIKFLLHRNNIQIKGLAITTFIGTIGIDSFFIIIPLILNKTLNLSPEYISGFLMIVAIFALIAPFIGEKVSHKYGSRFPLFLIYIGITISIVIFALSKNIILSIISLIFFSILETASITINDSKIQNLIPSKNRAILGSAINLIWAIAFSLSAFLTGLSISFLGLTHTALISGSIVTITSFIYLFFLKD